MGRGCLAIWTRIEPDHLPEYRRWLSNEHIGQRLDIPGVHSARVFVRDNEETSHFILYNVENASIFQEPAYLDVLNNPTSWTKTMMPRLRDFDRAVGTELVKLGQGAGAFITVGRLEKISDLAAVSALSGLKDHAGFAALRLYEVERNATDLASAEKTMRTGGEGQFGYLMVVEALSEGMAIGIFETAAEILDGVVAGHVGSFRQSYMLVDTDRELTNP